MCYSVVIIVSLLRSLITRSWLFMVEYPSYCHLGCEPSYYIDLVPNDFGSKKNIQKCLFYQAVVYQTTSKPLATQEDVEAAIAEVMITQP